MSLHFDRVVVHKNCPDGLASAMILRAAYPQAAVEFVGYGAELERLELGRVLFCDISPPADRALAFVQAGAWCLDHHKTAAPVTCLFAEAGQGRYADEAREPGVSGAVLAHRHVVERGLRLQYAQPEDGVEAFAALAGVRDTWQTKDPRWAEACAQAAALMFYGADVVLAVGHPPCLLPDESRVGRLLHGKRLTAARDAVIKTGVFVGRCLLVPDNPNGDKLVSDMAEDARNAMVDVELLAAFSYDREADGEELICRFSLRSLARGFDVSKIAKASGGGGHSGAAGFEIRDQRELSIHGPADLLRLALVGANREDLL